MQPASPVHIEVEGIKIAQSMMKIESGPLSSVSCCSKIGDSSCFTSGAASILDTHPLAVTEPFFCRAIIVHDNPYPCDLSKECVLLLSRMRVFVNACAVTHVHSADNIYHIF